MTACSISIAAMCGRMALTSIFIPMDGSAGAREIFDRMGGNLEFDIAEMSSSEFIARKSAGNSSLVALAGISLARIPARHAQHQSPLRHQIAQGSRGQARRRADLFHERCGLDARASAARLWGRSREASAGSKARSTSRALMDIPLSCRWFGLYRSSRTPFGKSLERFAGERRDRCHCRHRPAGCDPPQSRYCAPVSAIIARSKRTITSAPRFFRSCI